MLEIPPKSIPTQIATAPEATANDIGRDDNASPRTLMDINFLTSQSERLVVSQFDCGN